MSKLDDLRRTSAGNVDDSFGVGRSARTNDAPAASALVPARWQGVTKSKAAAEIPVDRIGPDPDQPREEFDVDSLERLAESLRTRGQLQPIRVRWDEGRGQYVIICGERRWRAAMRAGFQTVSCVVSDAPLVPGELLALQLIENCVREDLKPIEQAKAFRSLMALNGWSGNQLAREIGVTQPTVVRTLALLELPEHVQAQVELGALPPASAYEVSKLDNPDAQREVADLVVRGGLSRSETAEVVRERASRRDANKGKGRGPAKAKKVTSKVYRAAGGKVTFECRRGADEAFVRAALAEVLTQLDRETPVRAGEAA